MAKKEYVKMLRRKYAASDATLESKLDALDISALEAEAADEFSIEILDPPVVNGIKLREHPTPSLREYYTGILDSGGVIGAVYDTSGKLEMIIPTVDGGTAKRIEDFNTVKQKIKERRTGSKIVQAIDDDFEKPDGPRDKRKIPKTMLPEDFWELFPRRSRNKILTSDLPQIQEWVTYVNSQEVIEKKDKTIRKGVKWLIKNKYVPRNFLNAEEEE